MNISLYLMFQNGIIITIAFHSKIWHQLQVPCIERNRFGTISAYLAASLALRENGEHLISLDRCIETMKKLDLICQADIKKPRSVDLRSA